MSLLLHLMDISGELCNNHILIKKSSDIGRLYNKSHIGKPLSGNVLQLDLLEGVFLINEGKMQLFQNKKPVTFSELLMLAAQQIPEFETKYIVYKDLRNRGHAITLAFNDTPITFSKIKKNDEDVDSCVIVAFSERDILEIAKTKQLIQQNTKNNNALWFALVDEEGDLTYYDISKMKINGDNSEHQYQKGTCILLKNRLILFDKKLVHQLYEKEFFGKPFGEILQLSFVEGLYLLERGILDIQTKDGILLSMKKCIMAMEKLQPDIRQRLLVFRDLKQRGLLVKTGFKFGAHFRAYTHRPEKTHAEYLIHVVEKEYTSIWAEISRAVRLAHSVNKEFVFACIDNKIIEYIKVGRLRP